MRTGIVEVLDVPTPQLRGPGVLVQTAVSLISAGTERASSEFAQASLVEKARSRPDLVEQVLGKMRRDGLAATLAGVFERLDRPAAPGYATAGVVLAVADGVPELVVGDRVACAGATYATHAEINYVPRNLVVPIPRRTSGEEVGFDEAAFTTLGAIALHGIRLAQPQLGDRAVVIGLGVIGLLTVQILRAHGCRVAAVDLDAARCDLARALGADAAAAPADAASLVTEWTQRLGADLVLVAAATEGSDPAILAADLARDKGRIVAVGATGLDLPRRTLFKKELSVVVSRSYGPGRYDPEYEERGRGYPLSHVRWTERENMRAFLDLIADDRIDVQPLISQRFAIEHGDRAYAMLNAGPALGILLDYSTRPLHDELRGASAPQPAAPARPTARRAGAPLERVHVAAIGAGNFARGTLFPLLARNSRVALRTIVASTGLSAHGAAERFGFAKRSTDHGDIWTDESCAAVVIATRHDSHAALVLAGLQSGKAVFVEKPLCITEEELARIVSTIGDLEAAGHAPLVMVGFNRRFAPAVQAVRARVARTAAPVSIVYRINAGRLPASSWIADAGEGGGRIVGEVCHFVDLCAYLAGSPVEEVSAIRSAAGEEDVAVSLRMRNGSIATIAYLVGGSARVPKERLEIFGSSETAIIDDFRRVTINGRGVSAWRSLLQRQDKGHRAELDAFVDAVARGTTSPVPMDSAINSTRATFAILRSLEINSAVRIP
jgi:predicted dehydrogenase/threonine dehydrogenase-like Zn-dependent dehydrogenase